MSIINSFESSDAYTLIGGRIKEEIESLKPAYEVKGDKAAKLSGYYEGLQFFFSIIEAFKRDGEITRDKRLSVEDSSEENKLI
jgi:hypothetical protein